MGSCCGDRQAAPRCLFFPMAWGADAQRKNRLSLLALKQLTLADYSFLWQPADWERGLSSVIYGPSLVLLRHWITVMSSQFSAHSKIMYHLHKREILHCK